MLSRQHLRSSPLVFLAISAVILSVSCSRLQKRNDGGGQGTSTVDEGGNNQPVESSDNETGGSATADENSLSGDDSIYVEEGVELATDVTGAYLTLPPGVERGGDSVSVFPAKVDTKIVTFITVKIPLDPQASAPAASLTQDIRELVLFYKIKKPDGSVLIGVRPVANETVVGNEIIFQTGFFGVYQAGYIKKVLTEPVEKPVGETVFTKKEETAIAPLVWGDLVSTVDGKSLKFSATYTYAEDLVFCLVRITKDTAAGTEVLRADVTAPQYTFTTPEPGVTYFAHFKCRAKNGVESVRNSSKSGAVIALSAPLAQAFSATMTEDVPSPLSLVFDSAGPKPDACAITGVLNVTATCSCNGDGCTAQVIPGSDFNGTALLDFTLAHKGTVSPARRATITVSPLDDVPVAENINLGAVGQTVPKSVVLNYSDADGDKATTCELSDLQNATETPSCACTDGLCVVEVSFPDTGNGSFKFKVTAGGAASNIATVTFNAQTNPPAAVKFVRLDFSYPGDTTPVLLKDKIVLSGGGSIEDYDFYLQGTPDDVNASVGNYSAMGRIQRGTDSVGDSGSGQGDPLTNPAYVRGSTPLPFDSFRFALKHKASGNWLDNASPVTPAWAFTCNPASLTSWNDRRQGPDGPYLICSSSQFLHIGASCQTGSVAACGQLFRQIADIDFSAGASYSDYVGRGVAFTGSYDGAGHELKNYQIISGTGLPNSDLGLFGRLGGSARIERLKLNQSSINYSDSAVTSFGFLVGRSEGSDIRISDIEVVNATVTFSTGSNGFGGIIGSALEGTTVSNVRVKQSTLTVPPDRDVNNVGPVFGFASDGALIERASVDEFTRINVNSGSAGSKIGGLGGGVGLGAKVRNSYTRAAFTCNSTDSGSFGGLFAQVDGGGTELADLYGAAVIPECSSALRGGIAGNMIDTPTMLRLHFDYEKVGTMNVFGGNGDSYSGVSAKTTLNMKNNAFPDWDFLNVWQQNASEPPTLRP